MTQPSPDRRRYTRDMAEAQIRASGSPDALEALSPVQTRAMLHELRVHQIELEMQNEELRRAQVELDATLARYFDLYDLAPVGYCTLSEHGLLLQANLTAASLLGLARQALIRQPISRFILKADQDIYYLYHKQLLETAEAQSCELRMVKNDGTPFWAHLMGTHAQDADGVPVHRVVLIDVSERKRMEAALQDKNTELEGAKRAADKANQAKSEFLSSMSHELRSPLNAILGFAQLMQAGSPALTATQSARIEEVLKAGWYLLELINEILDLAVVESGKLSLSLEPLSLSEVMLECETMIESQAQESGIRISFSPSDCACVVNADRTHLKQVLINLLSNAVKYNRRGGSVEVTCSSDTSNRVRISVRDTGAGLPAEKLVQLFQPFNRLGQETGLVQGTGIGLVVSKRLTEMMGGEIGVQSTVGLGSVFWIELDSAIARQLTAAESKSLVLLQAPVQAGAALRTVLYIEDNRANMQLVEEIIALRPNMRFLSAVDGFQGIALARTHQPAVILMDIDLPDISGLEALRILRADPATQQIPVLALSANAIPRDIQKGLAAGFFRYVTKPIRIDTFMEALDLALEFARNPSARADFEGTP